MKRLITASDVLYFSDYQVDNIGELVADNLTHKYRSDGADFYYKYGKQGFDWNSGKYFVEVTCEVSSHYDAEINTNSRYGAYLDGMNGKYYTAKKDFSYNRYDTQDTMANQLVISLTDDIENQIFSAVNPEMVETCSKVTAATHPDFADDKKVKFFYKHKFLGACDPEYMECDGLYDLIKSDKEAATQILNYMNSLGDPVFPVSEEDYGTPETNVDNVDIDELYYWFMKELSYDYDDHYESIGHFYNDTGDFEIFDGPVVEDNVIV